MFANRLKFGKISRKDLLGTKMCEFRLISPKKQIKAEKQTRPYLCCLPNNQTKQIFLTFQTCHHYHFFFSMNSSDLLYSLLDLLLESTESIFSYSVLQSEICFMHLVQCCGLLKNELTFFSIHGSQLKNKLIGDTMYLDVLNSLGVKEDRK